MDIFVQNEILLDRVNTVIKNQKLTKDTLIEKIIEGLVPKSANREFYLKKCKNDRTFLLEKMINNASKTFSYPVDFNDVFRCILKILLSPSAYKKLLNKIGADNISSNGGNINYDPAKNGQNILKHGLIFHAVPSYSHSHFPLISPNRNMRKVLFTRYYFEGNNHIYIDKDKPNKQYAFVATVFDTNTDGTIRFISSRFIDLDGDMDSELQMLISENNFNQNELNSLRDSALRVLKGSRQYI